MKKRTFRWMQSSHVNPFAFRQNNWHFLPHPSINLLSLLIMTFNELATSCHLRTCVVGAGFKPRIMGIWVNPVRKLAVVSPSYFLLRHFDLRMLSKGRPLLVFFFVYFHAWLQLSIVGCGKQVESKHLHWRRHTMILVCVHMHVNDTMFSPLSKAV